MLIYANYQENDGVDLNFFASKEAHPIVKQLEKITKKKAQAKVVKCAQARSQRFWGVRDPPKVDLLNPKKCNF